MEKKFAKWTEQEDAFLRSNLGMTDHRIARHLLRTENGVRERRIRLDLKKRVQSAMPSERKWHEHHALKTAREYVLSLGDAPTYERVAMIQKRINEATACLFSLYANGPGDRGWSMSEERAALKISRMIGELRAAYNILSRATAGRVRVNAEAA